MDDTSIVNLYWDRDEKAISETKDKYEHYLTKIAHNVLFNPEDEEEVVNDTYFKAWNSMPNNRPDTLAPYLGKITRELSIDVYRKMNAKKRAQDGGQLSIDELEEYVSGTETAEDEADFKALVNLINEFLGKQKAEMRIVFICRYFYMDSISEIATYFSYSESKVKGILFRMRESLSKYLTGAGYVL